MLFTDFSMTNRHFFESLFLMGFVPPSIVPGDPRFTILEHVAVIGFRLTYVEEQIEIIKEEAIFSRLEILPFAILAIHLILRALLGDPYCEVFVPAWHWFLRWVTLSIAPGTCFWVNH